MAGWIDINVREVKVGDKIRFTATGMDGRHVVRTVTAVLNDSEQPYGAVIFRTLSIRGMQGVISRRPDQLISVFREYPEVTVPILEKHGMVATGREQPKTLGAIAKEVYRNVGLLERGLYDFPVGCPSCGEESIRIVESRRRRWFLLPEHDGWFAQCPECGARGPVRWERKDAIYDFGRRIALLKESCADLRGERDDYRRRVATLGKERDEAIQAAADSRIQLLDANEEVARLTAELKEANDELLRCRCGRRHWGK